MALHITKYKHKMVASSTGELNNALGKIDYCIT